MESNSTAADRTVISASPTTVMAEPVIKVSGQRAVHGRTRTVSRSLHGKRALLDRMAPGDVVATFLQDHIARDDAGGICAHRQSMIEAPKRRRFAPSTV